VPPAPPIGAGDAQAPFAGAAQVGCVCHRPHLSGLGAHRPHFLAFPGHVLDRISALGTPLGRICVDLLTFFAGRYRLAFGFDAPPVHDPVAVARAIDRAVVTTVEANVAVELFGMHTRGEHRHRPAQGDGTAGERAGRGRPGRRPFLGADGHRHRRPGLMGAGRVPWRKLKEPGGAGAVELPGMKPRS